MKKTTKIIITIIVVLVLGWLGFAAFLNKGFTSVKNFDDCVAAGGVVVNTRTPQCKINGYNYSGIGFSEPIDTSLFPAPETPPSDTPQPTPPTNTTKFKVYGKVSLARGDCMPTIGNPPNDCSIRGISTKIYVRQFATMQNMNATYLKTPTKLVTTASSASDGSYSINLPAGSYSIFVDDNGKEYCNGGDDSGGVCHVNIKDRNVQFNIQIDHAVW